VSSLQYYSTTSLLCYRTTVLHCNALYFTVVTILEINHASKSSLKTKVCYKPRSTNKYLPVRSTSYSYKQTIRRAVERLWLVIRFVRHPAWTPVATTRLWSWHGRTKSIKAGRKSYSHSPSPSPISLLFVSNEHSELPANTTNP
jgi:hypothetical protein